MQADFTLYVRDCFDCVANETYQKWMPVTLLYIHRHSGPFEIFARAQSNSYFDKMKCMFDIEGWSNFNSLFEAFKDKKLSVPSWDFTSIEPALLIGFKNLATRP